MLTAPKSNSRHLSIRLTDYSTWSLGGATANSESVVADEPAVGGYFKLALCAFATRIAHRAHRVSDVHEK